MHSNGELLGTLCEKRHNAVVVMDNKYFITLVSVHIAVIALVGCFDFCSLLGRENSCRLYLHNIT